MGCEKQQLVARMAHGRFVLKKLLGGVGHTPQHSPGGITGFEHGGRRHETTLQSA